MVHQHFMLVPVFTVTENIVLGDETMANPVVLDTKKADGQIRALAEQFGFQIDPGALVGELSVGIQQRVEILKALYRGARILILDEPTAVLTPQETVEIFAVLRRLAAEGTSIVFISHKLYEVLAIADRITVIRRGRVVGEADPKTATEEDLAEMMVGREVSLTVEKGPATPGDVVLAVDGLTVADDRGSVVVQDCSFEVRAGEILGIAGVAGNGQAELVEAIVGLRRAAGGSTDLAGTDVTNHSVRELTERGLAYIPGDRQRFGLVLSYPVDDNLVLTDYYKQPYSRFGVLNERAISARAEELIPDFDIRTPSATVSASTLSGGNQQKVIVAREFSRDVTLLVADQPTRGLDVGSIEFIHKQIVAKRDAGAAVLLVSAELDEIMELSDRIAVMYRGRLVATLDAAERREGAGRPDHGDRPGRRSGRGGCGMTEASAPAGGGMGGMSVNATALVGSGGGWRQQLVGTAIAVVLGLLVGALLILLSSALSEEGFDPRLPFTAYAALLEGSLGSMRGIGNTLNATTPLILTGLSVAFAFRAGLFNIGAQGQFFVGAFVAAVVGAWIGLPFPLLLLLSLFMGFIGGAAWGFIPGALKAWRGAHEVVVTIMLNSIAALGLNLLASTWFKDPGASFPRTPDVHPEAVLPILVEGTKMHAGIIVALLAAVVVWFVLFKSTLGFEIRTTGANPNAARYAGIRPAFIIVLTMSIAGGLAGLAGAVEILGITKNYPAEYNTTYGFDGIAVALLGRVAPVRRRRGGAPVRHPPLRRRGDAAGDRHPDRHHLHRAGRDHPVRGRRALPAQVLPGATADGAARGRPGRERGMSATTAAVTRGRIRISRAWAITLGVTLRAPRPPRRPRLRPGDRGPGRSGSSSSCSRRPYIILGFAVPIAYGALCGVMNERSGVVNIGIEGMILSSAFTGFLTGAYLQPGHRRRARRARGRGGRPCSPRCSCRPSTRGSRSRSWPTRSSAGRSSTSSPSAARRTSTSC